MAKSISVKNPLTLADKMTAWKKIQKQAEVLRAEIEAEVMALQQTQEVDGVRVTYSQGRGSYNYEAMTKRLEPDDGLIAKHTKTVINYTAICADLGVTDEFKSMFYTAGNPSATLKLL